MNECWRYCTYDIVERVKKWCKFKNKILKFSYSITSIHTYGYWDNSSTFEYQLNVRWVPYKGCVYWEVDITLCASCCDNRRILDCWYKIVRLGSVSVLIATKLCASRDLWRHLLYKKPMMLCCLNKSLCKYSYLTMCTLHFTAHQSGFVTLKYSKYKILHSII